VPLSALIGNGDYYSWGTVQVSAKPDRFGSALVNKSGGYAKDTTTINVNSVSGFSLPRTGSFVRFAGHNHMPYKVVNSTSTSITLDTGLTTAVAHGAGGAVVSRCLRVRLPRAGGAAAATALSCWTRWRRTRSIPTAAVLAP